MTDNEFAERLVAIRETMYRVSYAQLPQSCDRDDAVQEALLKAWGNRRRMNDEQFMKTWVIRILINECHNIQRKKEREFASQELPEWTAPAESNVDLHDALFRLDEKLRLPIVLHYMEGYRTREISKILAIPHGTVLWRMSKARKELGAMLGADTQILQLEE